LYVHVQKGGFVYYVSRGCSEGQSKEADRESKRRCTDSRKCSHLKLDFLALPLDVHRVFSVFIEDIVVAHRAKVLKLSCCDWVAFAVSGIERSLQVSDELANLGTLVIVAFSAG